MGCLNVHDDPIKGMLPGVTVSLVSHGQLALARETLADVLRCPEVAHIVLTINVPETLPSDLPGLDSGKLTLIRNTVAKGFGQNHNAAFQHCRTELFCVINPDVRLAPDAFTQLSHALHANPCIGLISPIVLNKAGRIEDSARAYPTPVGLLLRLSGLASGVHEGADDEDIRPDWVAGMFMLLRSSTFERLGGFDEGFFMYCEDIDLCLRLRAQGLETVRSARARIVHDARRGSHRRARYMLWHVSSLLRLWQKHMRYTVGLR